MERWTDTGPMRGFSASKRGSVLLCAVRPLVPTLVDGTVGVRVVRDLEQHRDQPIARIDEGIAGGSGVPRRPHFGGGGPRSELGLLPSSSQSSA